jgi:hypothetical protein
MISVFSPFDEDRRLFPLTELVFVSTGGQLHVSEHVAQSGVLQNPISPYEIERYIFGVLSKP